MKTLAMFLALLASTATVPAFAEDIDQNAVLCDTLEQVQSIASAPDPHARYLELKGTTNATGEPVCVMAPFSSVPATDVVELGIMTIDGKPWKAWGVHVESKDANGNPLSAYILKARRDFSI